ncbi:MAG: ABC transporter ATP-binding protein [Parachlamydiales bacterium]|jgi:oligopeptide/dipeptide ABC transporter ATP-binding protein
MDERLIRVKNLSKNFIIKNKILKAVDNIDFEIKKAQTFAIVGESGCGKTTIANMIANLIKPTSGEIYFENTSIFEKSKEMRKNIQMIFQDPFLSLNPRMKVESIILEPIKIHHRYSKKEELILLDSLLEKVKLPINIKGRFPHEFSGGQKQRIAIARAISTNPKFIICDEPFASLDVSISAQIINLLLDLKSSLNLSYLFISHNLAIVKHISDHTAVMYLGNFLEKASTKKIFSTPLHPYTQALISSSFSFKKKCEPIILKDEIPSLLDPPKGCLFSTRCPMAKNICFKEKPILKEVHKEHFAACHLL